MDERETVESARNGDEEAYAELVRTYRSKVFNMAYGFTENRESADDMAQEIFLKAYLALPRFRFGSSFGTWLYRIAVNHLRDFLRKRPKVREVPLDAVGEPAAEGDAIIAREREREVEARRRLVRRELASLPEKYRMVLTLRDVEGLPYEEIARVLRLSPGTLDSRLHRARKMLRKKIAPALGREGGSHEMP
jgi:RNA polymerase sigma-70 factor, ECF subfamily